MQDSELSSEPLLCRRSTRRSSSQWTAPPSHSGSPRIDLVTLQDHFHLPITEVAKKLGVCATVLKKVCRGHGITRWPHRKIKSLDKQIALLEAAKSKGGAPGLKAAEELETIRGQKEILVRNPNGHSSKSGMKHRRHTSSRKTYHTYDQFSDCGSDTSTSSSHHTRSSHRSSTDSTRTFSTSPCTSSTVKMVTSVSTTVTAPPPRHRSASVSAASAPRATPYGRSYSVSSTPTPTTSENTVGRVPRVSCLGKIAPKVDTPLPLPSKLKVPNQHYQQQVSNPSLPSHHPSMRSPSPVATQQTPMSVPPTLPAFTPTGITPPYSSYVFGNYYPMAPHPNFQMMDPQIMRYFGFSPAMPPHFAAHPHHPSSLEMHQQAMMSPSEASFKNFAPIHAYGPPSNPSFVGNPASFAHASLPPAMASSMPSSGSTTARSDAHSYSESSDGELTSLMDLANTASPDGSVDESSDKSDQEAGSSPMEVDAPAESSSPCQAAETPSNASASKINSPKADDAKSEGDTAAQSTCEAPISSPHQTNLTTSPTIPRTLEAY